MVAVWRTGLRAAWESSRLQLKTKMKLRLVLVLVAVNREIDKDVKELVWDWFVSLLNVIKYKIANKAID